MVFEALHFLDEFPVLALRKEYIKKNVYHVKVYFVKVNKVFEILRFLRFLHHFVQ